MLGKVKKIHFVGIGGIGMSGIAEFLHNQGFQISGSDLKFSEITENLKGKGIPIIEGHDPNVVKDSDVLVKSSAVDDDNPEVQYALKSKIPVIRRAEMLAELIRMSYGIAIGGTHGKTTTTSMVGLVLSEAKLEPTIIVGGKVRNFGSNNVMGSGKYIIVEADEFDKSFLNLTPVIAGITNIEADHLDCYKDLSEIKSAFIEFANKVPFFGSTVICLDDSGIQEILPKIKKRVITYGFNPQADVRAQNILQMDFRSYCDIYFKNRFLGKLDLKLMGKHNILNALMAVSIGLELDLHFETIAEALNRFRGVFRRFEYKGLRNGVLVYDDYAHHPTEIKATLKGLKENTRKKIIALFQPHLYSRTKDFFLDFGKSFFNADVLIITPIFPAREKPISGVSSKLISDAAIQFGHKAVVTADSNDQIVDILEKYAQKGDIIISLGAGDIYKYAEKYLEKKVRD